MNLPAKQFPVRWRFVSWLATVAWIPTSHALAAEFQKVNEDLGYVRVGNSENNVYVVGSATNALIVD